MQLPFPITRDLVLVGGGHAHALVLRKWGMRPLIGARLTLITPQPTALYSGMLPGLVAGHYEERDLHIDLMALAQHANARVIIDEVTRIDRAQRHIHLKNRPPVFYDIAGLNIGITTKLPNEAGAQDHVIPVKPLPEYIAAWNRFLARALPAPRIIIIGGGIAGAELALASYHRLVTNKASPHITLLEQAPDILGQTHLATKRRIKAHLARAGVELRVNAAIAQITDQGIELQDGAFLAADFIISCTSARPHEWLQTGGFALENGFIRVNDRLQTDDPRIFAGGDCAHLSHAPRPKAGVFAVRSAPVLAHNLRIALQGKTAFKRYQPQKTYLKLVSLGAKNALADKALFRFAHPVLWRWKDRIDRAFMAKFSRLPPMPQPALPADHAAGAKLRDQPFCGGCGAKIGASALEAALATLPPTVHANIIKGAGDDSAIIRRDGFYEVITTDHLRAFTEDYGLMTRICAIHAMGDIWAMGARPHSALMQLTLPPMAPRQQSETLREIMAIAGQTFGQAGADIIGGHSAMGAEFTIGFTIIGHGDSIITKQGAQMGDGLIITKPIGSGILLAAAMAQKAPHDIMPADALQGAHQVMQQSLAGASTILAPMTHALTDITGFGLAGHLWEICRASGCGAVLNLADIPALPGAANLAAQGFEASLTPANRAALQGMITPSTDPIAALLHDPQTAGGLLASVGAQDVEPCLAALNKAGFKAACIGHMTEGAPYITLI